MFFANKHLLSKSVALDTCNAKLTTLPKLFRQETGFFLLNAQKSKCFISAKIFSSKCSAGHVECLFEEPGVFLRVKISREKPWKDIKLYLLPETLFPRCWPVHEKSGLENLVESFCQKSAISSFKISKQSQIYVFPSEKNLLSQSVSLDTRNAVLTTPLKTFAIRPAFSCSLPKSRNFLVSAKFFSWKCWHFWRKLLPKIWNLNSISEKKQNYVFFSKKKSTSLTTFSGTRNAVITALLKLFLQKTGNFSLIA